MQRTSLAHMACPIARSLDRVGEWWSMLILRDAFAGLTRFDQFGASLGIAPNMLARRLSSLVEAGLLERKRYSEHPPRFEYELTACGRDFRPVLLTLLAFGNKHFAPEGPSALVVDAQTGIPAEPLVVDARTLRPLDSPAFRTVTGPAARAALKRHPARDRGRSR